jgi:hypothetical protein
MVVAGLFPIFFSLSSSSKLNAISKSTLWKARWLRVEGLCQWYRYLIKSLETWFLSREPKHNRLIAPKAEQSVHQCNKQQQQQQKTNKLPLQSIYLYMLKQEHNNKETQNNKIRYKPKSTKKPHLEPKKKLIVLPE